MYTSKAIVADDLTGKEITSGGWLLAPQLGLGKTGTGLRNDEVSLSSMLIERLAAKGIFILVLGDNDLVLSA